ncbi:MAG: dioxygenase [Betaproteobacteria bacterium HGW-Betaproteobacteria-8]|nr:MAG: dioxygenase [Betaproteobacteria bacterium HGW-Betaproteobacteria-8]
MTTLFISHGAPALAIEPGETGKLLSRLAESIPRPSAILAVSAHWDTAQPQISSANKPQTIHDFSGFPPALYQMQYPAPGAPGLAEKTAALLREAGFSAELDARRGLDHGAWVPLRLIYPDADIPVTQLSIQGQAGPQAHLAMGQAIASLQEDNVLILCSGAVTHNLRHFFTTQRDAAVLDYVTGFADWLGQRIATADYAALVDYRNSPYGQQAHPSEDHILPLFVALGAGEGMPVTRYQPENTYGILAMDVYHWSTTAD